MIRINNIAPLFFFVISNLTMVFIYLILKPVSQYLEKKSPAANRFIMRYVLFYITVVMLVIIYVVSDKYLFSRSYYDGYAMDFGYEYTVSSLLYLAPIRNKGILMVYTILMIMIISVMIIKFVSYKRTYRNLYNHIYESNQIDNELLLCLNGIKASRNYNKYINIYYSDAISKPCVLDLDKQTILIPKLQHFTDDELVYLISHELNHILCKDLLIKKVVRFIKTVYWYNPIAYRLCDLMMDSCEIYDDYLICNNLPYKDKTSYVKLMGKVYTNNQYASDLLLSFTPNIQNKVLKRIKLIMERNKYKSKILTIMISMLVILLVPCTTIVFASYSLELFPNEMESYTYEVVEPEFVSNVDIYEIDSSKLLDGEVIQKDVTSLERISLIDLTLSSYEKHDYVTVYLDGSSIVSSQLESNSEKEFSLAVCPVNGGSCRVADSVNYLLIAYFAGFDDGYYTVYIINSASASNRVLGSIVAQ